MPLKCEGCKQNCCKDKPILITLDEYAYLNAKKKINGRFVGNLFVLSPPCPFLVHERCSIYENRPLMCQKFPFYTHADEKNMYMGFHASCPQIPNAKGYQIKPLTQLELFNLIGLTNDEVSMMITSSMNIEAKILISAQYMSKKGLHDLLAYSEKENKTYTALMIFFQKIPQINALSIINIFKKLYEEKHFDEYIEKLSEAIKHPHLFSTESTYYPPLTLTNMKEEAKKEGLIHG